MGQFEFDNNTAQIAPIFHVSPETSRPPVFTTRAVRRDDIGELVELDMYGFRAVYDEYEQNPDQLREELREKFEQRIEKVGEDWIRVVEQDGKICGFIMSCPTAKTPEDFVSWEDTTDNGTLETTYSAQGPNVYVVSLTAPRPENNTGESPRNMLIMDQIGKLIQEGYERGFFESRMPGFREWVKQTCVDQSVTFEDLEPGQLDLLATQYANTRIEKEGKLVPLDPQLRLYESVGCKLIKVVPNAYQDGPSLNYGVVAVYENPLPQSLRQKKTARLAVGGLVRAMGRSHKVTRRVFK